MKSSLRKTVLVLALGAAAAIAAAPATGKIAKGPTLQLTPGSVAFGKTVTLSGVVPTRRAGQKVTIFVQACTFKAPVEFATVRTNAKGAYRYSVEPRINTTYSVTWNKRKSVRKAVRVQPGVTLKRVAAGRYRVEVATTNGQFLDGRTVVLQQAKGGGWATVAQGMLERASSEFALTLTSAATIDATVPAGSQLRAFLPPAQAPCYQSNASAAIAS